MSDQQLLHNLLSCRGNDPQLATLAYATRVILELSTQADAEQFEALTQAQTPARAAVMRKAAKDIAYTVAELQVLQLLYEDTPGQG
nr:hypothetical protein [Armatimonas sp.]